MSDGGDDGFVDDGGLFGGGGGGGGRRRRSNGGGAGCAIALIAALVLIFAAFAEDGGGGGGGGGGEGGSTGGAASPAPTFAPPPVDPPSDPVDPPPDPDGDAREPEAPDPVRDAAPGDCLAEGGTPDAPDLAPATCGDGVFEVREVVPAGADCRDYVNGAELDRAVRYDGYDLTLCLAYRHGAGSAYHAAVGDCVYGGSGDDARWEETSCQTGNFTVAGRLENESSWDDCDRSTPGYYGRSFTVSGWRPELDVRLCLRMNYPDDAGRSHLNTCLAMTGSVESPTFTFADCERANVYVTGRTSDYADADFCAPDAWATWRNEDFPDLGYTICWRWLNG
ncbi:LppU/SCO3897 family protein [Streptomyces triticirhizae]|uniref:Uncharacterized protein n=1 Tax=Streptomyces triticirhizae TaxID=2483353 RepID=A0A3M2M1Y2_9ACTN|nr:hypothetical protein [Streptomyces triticirhizae]RMI43546.1 hypothetical protein EBN88_07000 [Streptomyces triticirhizae]